MLVTIKQLRDALEQIPNQNKIIPLLDGTELAKLVESVHKEHSVFKGWNVSNSRGKQESDE